VSLRVLYTALVIAAVASPGQSSVPAAPAPQGDEAALREAAAAGSVPALLEIAELRSRRGDLGGTAEPLRLALALAPNSERVLAAYAQTAMAARAPGQALLALEPLSRMYPSVAQYAYLLGVAWMQLGDPASAQPALERARELEPRRPLTLAALGIAHNQQKRFAEAKQVLEEAIALAPDDAEVLGVLAEAEEGLGDRAAAEAHAKSALERAPGQATGLLVLGLVRMQEQRYAEARQAFEGALARSPDTAKTHYQLSLACARLGDRQCAAREVERYQKAQRDVAANLVTLRTQSLENLQTGEPLP